MIELYLTICTATNFQAIAFLALVGAKSEVNKGKKLNFHSATKNDLGIASTDLLFVGKHFRFHYIKLINQSGILDILLRF